MAVPSHTAAKAAYEEDVRRMPRYHDGAPRKPWEGLDALARMSWEKNPTPRNWGLHAAPSS